MSTPATAAGRPAGDSSLRRPFQGGGRFDRPVMAQEQIDALIRQARDNARRLVLDALQKTDAKYRSFIVPIGQWKKVGESGHLAAGPRVQSLEPQMDVVQPLAEIQFEGAAGWSLTLPETTAHGGEHADAG